jgi:uncharacterized protein YggE
MRTCMVVFVCILALFVGGAASAELVAKEVTQIPHPMLTVSGQGTVEVAPDTARVTAAVITEGDTVETARERNAQIIKRAMAAVDALKLPNVTTKTLNYTMERVTSDASVTLKIDPAKWDIPWKIAQPDVSQSNFRIGIPVTLGYRASNSLTVRIQGTREELSDASGRIVDVLMEAGANSITSVAYSLEKDENTGMREALVKAVKDAQMTAEAVAAAAGRKIVGVRNISPSYIRPVSQVQVRARFEAAEAYGGGTPTTVTAGMLEVTAQVSINYELDYNPDDLKFIPAPK